MTKLFLAILLVFSAFAVVAQSVLVYHSSTIESAITEDGKADDQPITKEIKDVGKEVITLSIGFYKHPLVKNSPVFILSNDPACSDGFYDKPYNPPEVI